MEGEKILLRALSIPIEGNAPPVLRFLLEDFRLAVNNTIRAGIQAKVTSRLSLQRLMYRQLREAHPGMYAGHLMSVFEIAGAILRNYRRELRKGKSTSIPYVRRLMMKTDSQRYKIDRTAGTVDLPIRAGLHVNLRLVMSNFSRKYLNDDTYKCASLNIFPDHVVIVVKKESPRTITPMTAISLDTNENSLDGIFTTDESSIGMRVQFPQVARIQECHHERRKHLQAKKKHDQRLSRDLCKREGRREHNRISYRLHEVANSVVKFAEREQSAIVIEDLKGLKSKKSKEMNRRLNMWPRRELHRILEYKAEEYGIPVIKVNPYNSSRTCPICGKVNKSRMGAKFECKCGWQLDRQINAGINLLQTASSKGLAGGLRFDPGAFQHDTVIDLCANGVSRESNGMSGNLVST